MRLPILVLGALLMAQAIGAPVSAAESSGGIPYTPGLDVTAMDPQVDPCEDFYQYACGGWRSHNPIPNDASSWNVYSKLHQDNLQFLKGILETAGNARRSRTESEQKIGDYYAACMDTGAIDRAGLQPISQQLARLESGVTAVQLPAFLAELHSGVSGQAFFSLDSSQDFADAKSVITFVMASGLGLPDRDYYLDSDSHSVALREAYADHVAQMLSLAGETPHAAIKDAKTVMRLETALARASLTRVEMRDPAKLHHSMSVDALHKLSPQFDWSVYLRARGLATVKTVNVTEPAFIRAFNQLLAQESPDNIRIYLRWHVLHGAAPHLSAAFRHEHFAFYGRALRGQTEEKPRWKTCVAEVDRQLGDALGREFVARAFSSEQKQATLRMTSQIETEMRRDIESLTWMSAATKREALLKLDSVVNKIGYPDHWRDYSAVVVDPNDYYGSLTHAAAFEQQRQLAKIGKPVDRSEWMMTPPTVNAYYDPQMNDINFPAGVLQPPLYDSKMDDAPNYGNTGGTIGHELTHGFDDEGRQFDAAGNLRDWWKPEDAKAFEARAQCIVDQYAGYVVVDDIHINSRLTLGEDAADLAGLMLAYNAWKAEVTTAPTELREGMTPDQRFFVGYAQWACENTRPENDRLQAKTDPHSPGRYRVNGLVVNMPEFEKAFACHKGQAMAKENRCRIW
jgi:endothelin-converting enzyme/putative endopeptidase